MIVIDIVGEKLEADGFGGLVANGSECCCEIGDLAPCGRDFSLCKAGYKHMDPRPENVDRWAIWDQKEPPTANQWEEVAYDL